MPRPAPLGRRLLQLLARLLPRRLARWLLLLPYRDAHRRLLAAGRRPREAQLEALRAIVEANRRTEFGRAHAFDQIVDLAGFLARVPLRSYAELEPYLTRQRRGEAGVVVASALVGFALSGGSRGRPRAIPVSAAGLARWSWAEELLAREAIARRPSVARGAMLHVLPCYQAQTSRGTLPLLPMPVLAALHGRPPPLPRALPAAIFSVEDEEVRFYLALRLALTRPVRVLRAASPGTLTLLAEHLEALGPKLLDDLASGRVEHLEGLSEEVRRAIPPQRREPALAARLGARLRAQGRLEPRAVWPGLEVLICATSGPARAAAARLPDRFGTLAVIDPGYRAAEAIVTLPWLDEAGGPIALGDQLLEFLPASLPAAWAEGATTVLPEELQPGGRYRPVVTGPNGLYRYLMDDVVEVRAVDDGLPRLILAGRAPGRLRLEAGALGEEEMSEAVLAACRSCGVTLAGFTGWLQPPAEGGEAQASAPEAAKLGWLSRLLRRARQVAAPAAKPVPSLAVALEAGEALASELAERLAAALDSELGRRCEAYDGLRTRKLLGPPSVLTLEPGTFARRSRRRLAEGRSDGHAPVPPLSDDGWVLS